MYHHTSTCAAWMPASSRCRPPLPAGRELARAVKQASRGASVNLKSEGGTPGGIRSSYKSEYCDRHDKAAQELELEANPEAYAVVRP